MPRLSDFPAAVRTKGWKTFFSDILGQIYEDNVLVWASALSYSWLLALFPFLIFLLTLLPFVPEDQKQQVYAAIDNSLKQLPKEAAGTLASWEDEVVKKTLNQTYTSVMSIGLLLALWTASGGMSATMYALDQCYDQKVVRPFYKQRPIAMLLTVVVSVLMLLAIAILPVAGVALQWAYDHADSAQKWLGFQIPLRVKVLLDIARWVIGGFLLMMVVNVVYHFGCEVKKRYRFVTPGAVFSVVSWVLLGFAFRFYIDHFAIGGYNKTYGALGGVVVLLFLMYLAATLLLVGAEINAEVDYAVLQVPRGTKDLRPAERELRQRERERKRQRRRRSGAGGMHMDDAP
jgi:membrane protein